MASYGFLKSEKMQISTSPKLSMDISEKNETKVCIEWLPGHEVLSIDKVLGLLLWQQRRIKMAENLHSI